MNYIIPIRLIIADDHQLILDGLRDNFRTNPEFEVVAEARDGASLLALTRELQPDVILTDIKMPGLSGIEATRVIRAEFPHIGIIGLSSYDEEAIIVDLRRAGAQGFLLKTAEKEEIFEAVRKAYKLEPYYSAEAGERVEEILAGKNYDPFRETAASLFTPRELEVIRLVCQGLSSKEIGQMLSLKAKTVNSYREDIMKKMQVRNTAAFVSYAIKNGLVSR